MQNNESLMSATFSTYQKLLTIHQRFIEEIERVADKQTPVSSLTHKDGVLHVAYLDSKFSAVRRTVAIDSQLIANEYAFIGTLFNNEEYTLLCLYLSPYGQLFLDPECTISFYDFNNKYIVNNILSKIQLNALSSPFFYPRD